MFFLLIVLSVHVCTYLILFVFISLCISDLLGDYEFDVELDYNEEMDEFEVHTHEVAKKSNVEGKCVTSSKL